jgi:rhodanese-related sulfurtransferase
MIYKMKKFSTIVPVFMLSFFMFSCGSEETTEESSEETVETEEVTEETEEEEAVAGIAEDLDNETFKAYLEEKEGILIDVRTADEFAGGTIEGAANHDWTNGDFEAAAEGWDKNTPTFVFCAAGGRSGQAKDHLVSLGFTEVYNLAGGYGGWTK